MIFFGFVSNILIDINQLLHITLRRSRTEGHALTLLIQELDKCTTDISIPTKSVVLAFDGPPAAAKLATQRRRRYGTILQSERKKSRLKRLKDRGIIFNNHPHDEEDDLKSLEEQVLPVCSGRCANGVDNLCLCRLPPSPCVGINSSCMCTTTYKPSSSQHFFF